MEEVLDAIIAQLNSIKDLDYDQGGFLDQIDLADDVWFDDPRILPAQSYPFMYVTPVSEAKVSETTADVERALTITVGVVVDPREYWDDSEVVETSASRESIRTMEAIRRHFERTSLRKPGGLAPGTTGVECGDTRYLETLRGSLYSRESNLTLVVRKKYPRLP